MRRYSVIFLVLLMLALAYPLSMEASLQLAVDWQVKETVAPHTLKLNWWLAPRWGVRSVYAWGEQDLGFSVVYLSRITRTYNSYLGLGVRDTMAYSPLPLNQKIEFTAGAELKLDWMIPGLSTALECRLVPANLVGEQNELAPFFGISLNYGSKPASFRTPQGVDDDLYLLAKLIRAEAEGEPYEGQVAVGAVVMNRVKSKQFPNTIYEVIYQPRQFSCLPKLAKMVPNDESMRAARDAMRGKDPSRGALYYYNPRLSSPAGLRFFATADLQRTVIIGNHQFFK